jgi:two-component system sensor histidine kinase/response regulator
MDDRLRLLVADDEPLIRKRIQLMLADRFRIHEAPTAHDVLQLLDAPFDAIILDIVFPDGNGIELCKKLKEHNPHRTVVVSSSMESVDAWDRSFQAGADGYVEKRELLSLNPRKIELMIKNLVERNCLRKEAEEQHQRQAELLSILSHDVRAPFQALLGIIDLLRKNDISESALKNVALLHDCVTDQLAFINSLLELLRLESGGTGLRKKQFDLNLPVNQSLQGLGVLANSKGIELTTGLQPDLVRINGDLGRILQVVNNLVGNAIKFTPRKGRVTIETRNLTKGGTQGAQISVADTGIGINPAERARIFKRFHRGRFKGTEGEKGVGLGLSICKEIVQLHGGDLQVEDNPGGGTIFRAWFPSNNEAGPGCGVTHTTVSACG